MSNDLEEIFEMFVDFILGSTKIPVGLQDYNFLNDKNKFNKELLYNLLDYLNYQSKVDKKIQQICEGV